MRIPTKSPDPLTFGAELREAERSLGRAGLDLVHWFSVGACNARLDKDQRLTAFDRSDAVGLLIGNSKALWDPFLHWLRAEEASGQFYQDPLDRYVERSIEAVLSTINLPSWSKMGHELSPRPAPMQSYAQASGLAHQGPAHLCVHLQHGLWIALRAVVVFDGEVAEVEPVLEVVREAAPNLCEGCSAPCAASPQAGQQQSPPTSGGKLLSALSPEQNGWLQARAACPVGSGSRYSDPQAAYHYSKKRFGF